MSGRPWIGIEVDLEANAAGRRYAKCYETYFDAVSAAGGVPVLVPPTPHVEALVARLDGLVMPGGDDLHASEWGESQRPCARFIEVDGRRLSAGKALLQAALGRGLPFLGVCYGMQLLNLLRGGSLIQDLPQEVPEAQEHSGPKHGVEVLGETRLAEVVGAGVHEVNSRHHQAVGRLGEGLRISARAPDGVVEAIEGEGAFVVGVQWHAEELVGAKVGSGLFEGLVSAAAVRSA